MPGPWRLLLLRLVRRWYDPTIAERQQTRLDAATEKATYSRARAEKAIDAYRREGVALRRRPR